MTTFNTGVMSLHDYSSLVPILNNLGAKHKGWGVKKEHYPLAVVAVIKVFKDNMGE